jgi:hypothetical protein
MDQKHFFIVFPQMLLLDAKAYKCSNHRNLPSLISIVSPTRHTQVGIPVISCGVMKAVFTLASNPTPFRASPFSLLNTKADK